MNTTEIAKSILQQLGGNNFIAMTGSNNFTIIIKEYNDIYNDMLQELFTEATGLYTHL